MPVRTHHVEERLNPVEFHTRRARSERNRAYAGLLSYIFDRRIAD